MATTRRKSGTRGEDEGFVEGASGVAALNGATTGSRDGVMSSVGGRVEVPAPRDESGNEGSSDNESGGDDEEVVSQRIIGEEPDGQLYCSCRKPYDGSFMVECEQCKNWYHPKCQHTNRKDIDRCNVYYCISCCKKLGKRHISELAATTESNPEQSKRKPRPSQTSRSSKSTEPDSNTRKHVETEIAESLGNSQLAQEIARKTETLLFNSCSRKGGYQMRAKNLIFTVRDQKNQQLRDRLLNGTLSPEQFASATADQLVTLADSRVRREPPTTTTTGDSTQLQQQAPSMGVNETGATSGAAVTEDPMSRDLQSPPIAADTSLTPPPNKRRLDAVLPTSFYTGINGNNLPNNMGMSVVWRGVINKSDKSNFGPFGVNGYYVSGQPGTEMMLPRFMEVAGRLELDKLFTYLLQLNASGSRRRTVYRLEPALDSDTVAFTGIYTYLQQRKRAGFIKAATKEAAVGQPPLPEELYLIPFSRNDQLPDFLKTDQTTIQTAVYAGSAAVKLLLVTVARISTLSAVLKHSMTTAAAIKPEQTTTITPPATAVVVTPKKEDVIMTQTSSAQQTIISEPASIGTHSAADVPPPVIQHPQAVPAVVAAASSSATTVNEQTTIEPKQEISDAVMPSETEKMVVDPSPMPEEGPVTSSITATAPVPVTEQTKTEEMTGTPSTESTSATAIDATVVAATAAPPPTTTEVPVVTTSSAEPKPEETPVPPPPPQPTAMATEAPTLP